MSCTSTKNFSFSMLPDKYLDFYPEPFLIYNTTVVLDSICFLSDVNPKTINQGWFQNMTMVSQVTEKAANYIDDIIVIKWHILWIALIALAISFLALILIRLLAGFFVWLTILVFVSSIFILGGYTMKESYRLQGLSSTEGA